MDAEFSKPIARAPATQAIVGPKISSDWRKDLKRRSFLLDGIAAGAFTLVKKWPKLRLDANANSLQEDFLHPSAASRPKTYWHWINGNITADGITRDLEAMHRAGVGGVQVYQVGADIPKGPVAYATSEHLQLLEHAAKEADRLGIEFSMMNSPGFSSSGGPWISPELSMQQFTWSETFVAGGKQINILLPEPYKKRGYYQDAFVLAFPSLEGEESALKDLLSGIISTSGTVDANLLTNEDLSEGFEIHPPPTAGQPAYIQFDFREPYRARSIDVYVLPPSHDHSGRLPVLTLEASGDGVQFRKICQLREPTDQSSIEVPKTANFPLTVARYFRITSPHACRIAKIRISGSERISDWPLKANFVHREEASFMQRLEHKPSSVTGTVPKGSVIDPASVMDITEHMNSTGGLQWAAPPGNWTILRVGQTTTGAENIPAPDGSLGLECDKFSRKAYDFHFNCFFGDMFPTLHLLASRGGAGAVIDSYEVGMQTWTKEFPQEFQRRRGYDLRSYLPAMTGRVVGSGDISDRFLWDIRRTHADLMDDYYYGRFAELCHQHGMKAYAEPYSGGPFEEIAAGSKLDVPMGEFWVARENHYSIKLASSIGHIFGKRIVSAESYTGNPVFAKWLQYPYAMKAQGDWMYTQGLNEFIFHAYAMQPHPTVQPGMTMGPWGWMHSRTNTWFSQESNWIDYARRCQHMLRQGLLVADLVYYAGVEVPINTPVWPDELSPTPPLGFYYDVTNAEGILNRMKAQNGQIVLPDGMSYRVLILPEQTTITLDLLRKVRDLVKDGANLVGPKPERTPGLSGYPESDRELRRLADEVWGDLDGTGVTERTFGQGRVFWGQPITAVLKKLEIKQDFEFTSRSGEAPINYIHRRAGDADIYFVANRRRQSEELVCTFRVNNQRPELWNPETGDITPVEVYDLVDGGVRLPLRLGPAGSVFVVFRSPAKTRPWTEIARNGETIMAAKPFPTLHPGRYRDVTNDFTISVWVNPDVGMGLLPPNSGALLGPYLSAYSFVIYPPAGNQVYGQGHSACGLAAARDGVVVYERSQADPLPALVARMPLAGWTHLAIVYKAGVPSIFVNGKRIAQGKKSGNVVHPGLGEALQSDGAAYFYGSMSEPKLIKESLDERRIVELVEAGVPNPEEPPSVELTGDGKPELLIWRNGHFTLQNQAGRTSSLQVSDIELPREIRGPWRVSFPPNLGAPPEVRLAELMSLHKHPEEGVRYFSGTATYGNTFYVKEKTIPPANRIYLDLGRVAVIAEVHLNGRNLGVLWKPPFRVDITAAIHSGENNLEVLVTNLWPNRLIGDEHLPPENEYLKESRVLFGGAIKTLPQWYIEGKPKPPGGRITFATWKHYDADSPLVESGLTGPVLLRTAVRRTISS